MPNQREKHLRVFLRLKTGKVTKVSFGHLLPDVIIMEGIVSTLSIKKKKGGIFRPFEFPLESYIHCTPLFTQAI